MRGRRVGRQAQIIPVLHSIADQDAAPTLSSKYSVSHKPRGALEGRLTSRVGRVGNLLQGNQPANTSYADTRYSFSKIPLLTVRGYRNTHNPPRAKIEIKAIFCLCGNSSPDKAGIGINKITISVAMCMDAFENHSPSMLRQYPGIVGFQNLATGMQLRKALRTAHDP